MSVYSISVFLHVVGALGLFASVGLEQAGLAGLGRASTSGQAREWVRLLRGRQRLDGPSGLIILATGFYMAATRWRFQPWMGAALLGMVLMAAIGAALTGRRVGAIARELPAGDGPVPTALRDRLRDPVLRASALLRAALGLGIVFDMSVKPDRATSLAALGVALALGGAWAALSGRRPVPVGRYGVES